MSLKPPRVALRSRHKIFVKSCIVLIVLLLSSTALLFQFGPVTVEGAAVRKVGPWIAMGGSEALGWTPSQIVQNVFLTKPYYAHASLEIYPSADRNQLNRALALLDELRIQATTKPELSVVEITVETAFDACSISPTIDPTGTQVIGWQGFQEYTNILAGYKPFVVSHGIWGEFTLCNGQWRVPVDKQLLAVQTAASIVEGAGLMFKSSGIGGWISDRQLIIDTLISYPVWSSDGTSWLGVKYNPTPSNYIIASLFGMKANTLSSGGHPWTESDVQAIMGFWHNQPSNVKFLEPMGCSGTASTPCNYLRDSIEYSSWGRDWIWLEQQKYPEFTWVGKAGGTPTGASKSYLDFTFLNASQRAVPPGTVTWKLFNGTQEVPYLPGSLTLPSDATYTLKTYYAGYLIKTNVVTVLNTTLTVRLSMFQNRAVPEGQVAFDKPLSTFAIIEQTSDTIAFSANSSITNHLIVVKSPRSPLYIQKDNDDFHDWSFNESQNVTVIRTTALGSFAIKFGASPTQPPQPPALFPLISSELLLYWLWLFLTGFALGVMPFIALAKRKRSEPRGLTLHLGA